MDSKSNYKVTKCIIFTPMERIVARCVDKKRTRDYYNKLHNYQETEHRPWISNPP